MEEILKQKLTDAFQPIHLDVVNESHLHSGPRNESHFKVLIVSDFFEGKNLLQRQRDVYDLLKEEMMTIHALSLRVKTGKEFDGENFSSPDCVHKNK